MRRPLRLLAVLAAFAAPFVSGPARTAADEPALAGIALGPGQNALVGKWTSAIGPATADGGPSAPVCTAPAESVCAWEDWQGEFAALRAQAPEARLETVNRRINRVPYRPDDENWGRSDYWAAPAQFFARGGDCEDYAIAKYVSLRKIGIPAHSMRLLVLRDARKRQEHAVLLVRFEGHNLVLDNLQDRLVEWAALGHYEPLYSLNEIGVWLHDPGVRTEEAPARGPAVAAALARR